MVVWLTGLSGTGKSTLARLLVAQLRARGALAANVDGDALRRVIDDPHIAHDPASRLANAYRVARASRWLEEQGLLVVTSTMSLFWEIHAWNRKHFDDYLEVWLKAEPATLRRRHPDRLYERADSGSATHVVGHDLEPEYPRDPHLVLDNEEDASQLSHLSEQVLRRLFP